MREFVTLGPEWVTQALKLSEDLEVDETGMKVRRKTEIQEPKGQFERSVYAKGFGTETPEIQEEIEKFFNNYGRASAVRMRRIDSTKEFKGSVFVEFADFSTVEKFLKADPKPQWKGEDLLTMSKEAYCEMKIKEKGLTGKSAAIRRDTLTRPSGRGFNAFQEMAKGKDGATGKDKPKPEIWLEFMGAKLRVLEEDGGSVKAEDVPHVKGATLKFVGCGGNASFKDLKDPLREHFSRVPFIEYQKGDDAGLVGFDKALSEADIAFVKEHVKTVNDKEVTWVVLEEEEEKTHQISRAQFAARQAVVRSQDGGNSGGRGGGRGGRGGRGARGSRGGDRGGRGRGGGSRGRGGGSDRKGGRDSRDKKPDAAEAKEADVAEAGEKRKRAIEPAGAADTGLRGQAVPMIQSVKKAKVDGEAAS
ncbi:hypothetical protein FIBSPDRAFT_854611 [Athelia psychrophila]|uniref:Uncharacterized protein n=1 Tax=Athelia psychrophila TaxID=1759441 RepID=A0A166PXY6_9AGAM|nr:hypothetical protein FIBSPDRAFT_854611 [Fibularhizoctonia sp. CBS 109695]